jgi:hypothetical protein
MEGHTLIDKYILEVVREAYVNPFTVSSNFARANASAVAMACCEDYITTNMFRDVYCTVWRVTAEGLQFLRAMDELERLKGNE